jgi:hypothetical protein
MRVVPFLLFVSMTSLSTFAASQDPESKLQEQPSSAPGASKNTSVKHSKNSHSGTSHDQNKKGKIRREKDAEGTKAPNRFDADINTKSKYHYGGQPLEVDTD